MPNYSSLVCGQGLTIENTLAQHVNVVISGTVSEGEDLSHQLGYTNLIHTQVGVRRNDCTATEVHPLP